MADAITDIAIHALKNSNESPEIISQKIESYLKQAGVDPDRPEMQALQRLKPPPANIAQAEPPQP